MTPMPIIVGIDPGSIHTGVVVVDESGRLVEHATFTRHSTITLDMYLVEVCQELATVLRRAAERVEMRPDRVMVAMESCVKPSPHKRRKDGRSTTDPQHIIDTALVSGMLLGAITSSQWAGQFVRIPPNRHGERASDAGLDKDQAVAARLYPPELFSARESTGGGHGRMHHQRAAWDVAGALRDYLRMTKAYR